MKTRITLLMSVLMMLTFVLTGCHKDGDYVNVVPKDAYAVASVDLKSIVTKCALTDSENSRIQQVLGDLVRGGLSAETQNEAETIIKSPSELGVDFQSPIYIFASPSFSQPTVLMRVDDSKKLKSTLETMAKENICQQLGEADGYTFTVIDSELLMFSKTALILANFTGHSAYEELKGSVTKLLGQAQSESIASQKIFEKMNARKEDIKFFASMQAIPAEYRQQLNMTAMNSNTELDDLSILGGLNFGNGDIKLQTTYYTNNKETEEMLRKQSKAAETIDRDFLSYFPKSTMAYASVGVNGKKLYEVLAENKELLDEIPFLSTETGKAVVSSFNGDISVGITALNMSGVPTVLAYAKMKNSDMLDAIYNGKDFFLNAGFESIEKKGKNEYIYKSPAVTVYYGMKKKTFYATNDKQLFDSVCKDANPSLEDADYVKNIKGKTFFAGIDVKTVLDMPLLKMAVGMGSAENQMYYNVASQVDYIEMSNTADGANDIRIVLADKNTNSLRQLVTFIGQFVGMQQ